MGAMTMYSVAETAKTLGVSTRTVYRCMQQEENPLRASKIGGVWRIAEADLKKFIDNGRNNPQTGEK